MKEYERDCLLEVQVAHYDMPAMYVGRIDALFKWDMKHLAEDWECDACRKKHTEWYRVDVSQALAVVTTWARWIEEKAPYGADDELVHFWAHFIFHQRFSVPAKEFDHDARRAHWNKLLSSSGSAAGEEDTLGGIPPKRNLGATVSSNNLVYRSRNNGGLQDTVEQVASGGYFWLTSGNTAEESSCACITQKQINFLRAIGKYTADT